MKHSSDDLGAARGCFVGIILGLLMWVCLFALWGCQKSDTVFLTQPPVQQSLSEQRDSIVASEARKVDIPVIVAIGVSHVENWTGDSMAVSKAGAIGLMQVMPKVWQHEFEEDCGCGPIYPRRRNACLGVHILKRYHDKHKTWEKALRAYHGSNDRPQGRDYISAFIEAVIPTQVEHHQSNHQEGA